MNGYKITAETYKRAIDQGKISETTGKQKIRVYEFLANCTKEDIRTLADSTALNDIFTAYLNKALDNADTDSETKERIMNEFDKLLSGATAEEITGGKA